MNPPPELPHLRCDDVSPQLHDWLSGDLAPERARDLAAHVADCARCTREQRELERLERLFARDAEPAPADVAEARMLLRRALARAGGTPLRVVASPRPWHQRLRRELPQAAGFLLLLALFVPVFEQLHDRLAPVRAGGVVASLSGEAQQFVAHVGAWLPTLPEFSLPAAPPKSLRAWFDALHSDAR